MKAMRIDNSVSISLNVILHFICYNYYVLQSLLLYEFYI